VRILILVTLVLLVLVGAVGRPAFALPPTAPSATRAGYSRAKFGGWNAVADRCDTRELVVRRDGSSVATDDQCHATSGRWRSYYDGLVIRSSSKLDIDHVVPLANAWISGARTWTAKQRDAFANDLTDPQLIAVSASSNRSKGDSGPDEWKPPRRAAWCPYARWWIDVKTTWKLTITAAEDDALATMLATC
jgi:hypothetical protein